MQDTSGFYKLDAELLYGPNFVLNKNYALHRDSHTENTYPIDGWYWFDSRQDALMYFNIIEETSTDMQNSIAV